MKGLKRLFAMLIVCAVACCAAPHARSFSFDLDSIAAMGKFPRFVVNTYRWGNEFFNGYDTTYVQGTGYKFSAKITADSWMDGYNFQLPDNKTMLMATEPSTSVGLYVSYLALSAGYDINISKLITGVDRSRQRLRFGFNCMLFSAEAYMSRNDIGTTIRKFGDASAPSRPNYTFNGINNASWGIDAYYFFNHKKYSEAASFNYSRIQKRSQGSFYTGFSIYAQRLDFRFNELPPSYLDQLPETWAPDYNYRVKTNNYAVRIGYGYNWVFAKHWVLGISESPIIGVRDGYVTPWIEGKSRKVSLSMFNRAKLSVVWNAGRWFGGLVGMADLAIINNHKTTYTGGTFSGEAVIGYRFNLW